MKLQNKEVSSKTLKTLINELKRPLHKVGNFSGKNYLYYSTLTLTKLKYFIS